MLISVEVSNMFVFFFSIILVILYLVGGNYLVRILRMNLLAFTKKILDVDDDDDGIACCPTHRHFLEEGSLWPIVRLMTSS